MRHFEKIGYYLSHSTVLTQKGLAAHMGVLPSAVNRIIHGTRKILADEIPLIEEYLGVSLDDPLPSQAAVNVKRGAAKNRRGFSDVPAVGLRHGEESDARRGQVPVFAGRLDAAPVGWTKPHPQQAGIENAYALYIQSGEMQPRYYPGETVYVHPHRPPALRQDCVVELKSGDILIRQLAAQTAQGVSLRQYAPERSVDVDMREIKSISAIVGRG